MPAASGHRPPRARAARLSRIVGIVVVACALLTIAVLQRGYRVHDVLTVRHLTNAVFGPAPPAVPASAVLADVERTLLGRDGASVLQSWLPTQAGVLWLYVLLVVALIVANPTGGRGRRLDALALLALSLLLFDIMRFFAVLADAVAYRLMEWVFTGIMLASLVLLARGVWWSRRERVAPWAPPMATRPVAAIALTLLTLTMASAIVREPDDAGVYTNLGAQRLRERGWFPYGDPLLSGSAGAGYGPVLFLAHLPFQWLLDRHPVNPRSPDVVRIADTDVYLMPPLQATQLTTLALHLVGVVALFVTARRLAGAAVAWGLVALYCGSPFVLGVGGPRESIGGITFISHIAPASLALLAFASLRRPLLAGSCLALSVATVFAPVFFVPAWLGYYWRDKRAAALFLAGIALAAVVVGGPVLARTRPSPGRTVIGTVVHDTVGHHQGADMYGLSPFGFWGGRGAVRAWFRTELVPGLSVSSPMFACALAFAASGFFLGRGRTPQQLAALTGALGIASQLWKIHGTGVYVNWYYPFLLLGLLAYPAVSASATGDGTDAGAWTTKEPEAA